MDLLAIRTALHGVHRWITAALLEEMKDLRGKASFEPFNTEFGCARCIRQRSVVAPTLWLKPANNILWNVEEK